MGDFEKIPESVTTPDVVEARIGALCFADGIPDEAGGGRRAR
ncbi:hypothetical protein [Streptomyces sp. LN549]